MSPPFDLYEIDGLPIVASSDEQAHYFAATGKRAKVPGDPGIQEDARPVSPCQSDECEHPARKSGWCHYHDPQGAFQRNLRERRRAA